MTVNAWQKDFLAVTQLLGWGNRMKIRKEKIFHIKCQPWVYLEKNI